MVLVVPAASAAPSTDILIGEVYGGGGNSGATLTQDFIELTNVGSAPVSVAGWSVQYLPAAPSPSSRWQATPLTGAVQPGKTYLVSEAKGQSGTVELPASDASGSISMAAGAGTVALVKSTALLTCLTAADCAADTRIHDLIGYGNATVRESAPAAGTSNTTSSARVNTTDTDNNSADFASGEPSPRNAAGEGPGGGTPPVSAKIHDIQGITRVSPLAGKKVADVSGVVTAIRAFGSQRGFWFQDNVADADPRTSEGLFVLTGSATPNIKVGDAVVVAGTVKEQLPNDDANSPIQSLTELIGATWVVSSAGNPLPQAENLDALPAGYVPTGGNIDSVELKPAEYTLDYFESRESMRVAVTDVRVVGPTTEFNEFYVTVRPNENPTARGGTLYGGYDQPNPGRVKVMSLIPFSQRPFPQANVNDKLAGRTEGPLDYSNFGGYTVQATTLGEIASGGLKPETTRKQRTGELAIGTYNVENLDPGDEQAKFDRLAEGIVENLANPDIVALEEIQDDNGATNDGTVSADQTLRKFTDTIVAKGGPRYEWRQINPANNADGGEPGGNIRVAFIFNPKRVSFVDRPGGDAATPVQVLKQHGRALLSVSPGRIDPANAAWDRSRKPLAGEFVFKGRKVFVVANHFNSKGGDQSMHGRFQPPNRVTEDQRIKQAIALRGFVDSLLAVDRKANIVLAGDLNDFQFSPALAELTKGGAVRDLIDTLPVNERYTYVFEGNSQVLDHTLTSKAPRGVDYDVVHINAEFAGQASDHDPQVVRLRPSTGDEWLDLLFDLLDLIEQAHTSHR
ncbi:lamin tail domain-containing protein [Kibdelosporangium philippinense]|uniref:Lamin tail domain-containing protein n=1 Tax=Kibdelosporangium philippinense TaxID=211113 RepID=A0ABS8ZNW6_9PSEU|nr:endonuclease/exonuclease/phosphatase family protein [Kibdelosporangium philippinense]MCE7009441.1 lamin tail domain-containing protein [Kibdelosporangium philippinense]